MPSKLAKHLPQLSSAERSTLFGSLTSVTQYPRGNPIREGVIGAYSDTMRILCIAATCLSVIPMLCSLIMPNWYLGDHQNAVDEANLEGNVDSAHAYAIHHRSLSETFGESPGAERRRSRSLSRSPSHSRNRARPT